MSAEHEHHEHTPEQAVQKKKPNARRPQGVDHPIVQHLNERLNQKAAEIRRLEDSEIYYQSVISDMENETAALKAMLDQLVAENSMLRQRLDLPAEGALDVVPVEEPVEEPDAP